MFNHRGVQTTAQLGMKLKVLIITVFVYLGQLEEYTTQDIGILVLSINIKRINLRVKALNKCIGMIF